MRKALVVAAALLVSTPPAVAGWFSDPEGVSPKERVVCKTRPKSGNTRFTNRVCRTAYEWDQISEASKRNASELVNRPQIETRRE